MVDNSADVAAGLPKYLRVANTLRERIRTGELAPGDPLPTEADLAAEHKLNRHTVRQAIAVLRSEGLVDVVHGKGTFVRQSRLIRRDPAAGLRYEHRTLDSPTGHFEAITGTEGAVEVVVTYAGAEATTSLAEAFGVDEGTPLLRRHYQFLVDDEPHQTVDSYLLGSMVAGTPVADEANERPGRGTMAQLRDLGVHVDRATIDVATRMPTPSERDTLRVAHGTPVFVQRRVMYAAGQPVEVADIIAPGDRLELRIDVDLTE